MKTRKNKNRNRTPEQGFTLLEILVSVTLVALMALALWSVFRTSITSWTRGTATIDTNQRHRSILDLVKKQMASIHGIIAPVDLQSGGAVYPIFAGARDSVQFISLNSLRFSENPGLTMVSYDLDRDGQGTFSLVEREEQYLGLDPNRESIFDRKDKAVTPIFENLTTFTFEYLDAGTNDQPSQWITEWNSRETGRLPAAISMTMVSRDPKGGVLSRHLVVPILAKPYDPRLSFVNPFDRRPRRFQVDEPRIPSIPR